MPRDAAPRAIGNPRWRIALFHILPNIMPALLVQVTLLIAAPIIAEARSRSSASASSRPRPRRARCSHIASSSPCCRSIFVRDGLRDALDPKER
jgi:peptide/nickel transport system permease protein